MYAVAFDLNSARLKKEYPHKGWQNAYLTIRRKMRQQGFAWKQGTLYFAPKEMDAVKCVLAVQELSQEMPWLKKCVDDMRLLNITEENDLSVAL